MIRYVYIAVGIGAITAALVSTLMAIGVFEPVALWLGHWYQAAGLIENVEEGRIKWFEILTVVLVSFGTAWCVVDVTSVPKKVLVYAVIAFGLLGISPALAFHGRVYEPLSASLAAMLAMGQGLLFARTELGRRKTLLEKLLGPRVSHATFNALMSSTIPPQLDGAAREVTVLTCRLWRSTAAGAEMETPELLKFYNLFLRDLSSFLSSRGAYLDHSGPELVRAYFGLLVPSSTHAEEACRAALELRKRIKNLRQEAEQRWFQGMEIGVGIDSGNVISGVYGSRADFYFSAVGHCVQNSRWLAFSNERYGTDLAISPKVYDLVRDLMEVRPMEMIYNPDNEQMSEIYQLLGEKDSLTPEALAKRDLFWRAVILYRERRYDEAMDSFSNAQGITIKDPLVEYYLSKLRDNVTGTRLRSVEKTSVLTQDGHARLSSLL